MTSLSGAWPVMLTPFTPANEIDHAILRDYTEWSIEMGSGGLFPIALSGEMYDLTATERVAVVETITTQAAHRVPIAAALPIEQASPTDAGELTAAGADIVVLISSMSVAEGDDDAEVLAIADRIIGSLPAEVSLGLYECPLPYHRVLGDDTVAALARTGRVTFFKETSHDLNRMANRVRVAEGTPLTVFNAGIENLAESVVLGVAGMSGWVVNVAPDLVARLTTMVRAEGLSPRARQLQDLLIEVEQTLRPSYPSSAKAAVAERSGFDFSARSRWRHSDPDPRALGHIRELLSKADSV